MEAEERNGEICLFSGDSEVARFRGCGAGVQADEQDWFLVQKLHDAGGESSLLAS